jgi:hypothetical protein
MFPLLGEKATERDYSERKNEDLGPTFIPFCLTLKA